MPRPYLIKAREERDLSQRELAERMGGAVKQATISRWETGAETPQPYQRRQIRDILKKDVDSYPHLFDLDNQWSIRGIRDIMEMLRRQFIEALAKIGGVKLFGDVSLALVSSPVVAPEEYIAQCRIIIDECWEWLNQGNYHKVERALNVHMSTLTRFANILSPYQELAASLAVEAKIIQILLATHNRKFSDRLIYCVEAMHFGKVSGDRNLYATAVDWHGNTYIYCYHQPQRAIALFNDALSNLDGNAPLIRSAIYSDLSIAYAQDTTQENYETKARDYAELAHMTIPEYPELDPLYQCIQVSKAELYQFEGKMYLYLAEHCHNIDYARKAYETFEKSADKQALNQGYLGGLLIKKADAARALGEMGEFVTCLTGGLRTAIKFGSLDRITQAQDVMHQIPQGWQKETAVQKLQKDISHALIVAHR